jgi:hypothetical protein
MNEGGVRVSRSRRRRLLAAGLGAAFMPAGLPGSAAEITQGRPPPGRAPASWGTYQKPFAADSLWNSRPVAPVLGDFVIPRSDYFPLVGGGKYSLEVFLANPTDPPMTIAGLPGKKGVWDPDAEAHRESITIPRWPSAVIPAEGADGHADVVDPVTGMVHSFHVLRFRDGQWGAEQYAWTRIDGRGWGDPAHYFQGARAAAVPSMGGLIRKHEIHDGDSIYRHALAVSLTFNALAAKPAYIFPATSADTTASRNTGAIPEGALVMLPEAFDTRQIGSPDLRKVVETLKIYGAYVVDRNFGTPFHIFVENGVHYNVHGAKWNNTVAADLDRIREALRRAVSVGGWLDGNGRSFTPERNLNLLSMRGPWRVESGSTPGTFDTWSQAVTFPETATRTVQVNSTFRSMNAVAWALPAAGASYRLTAMATDGAALRFQLRDRETKQMVVDSRELGNGGTAVFTWPENPVSLTLHALSGVGRASSVRGELTLSSR